MDTCMYMCVYNRLHETHLQFVIIMLSYRQRTFCEFMVRTQNVHIHSNLFPRENHNIRVGSSTQLQYSTFHNRTHSIAKN